MKKTRWMSALELDSYKFFCNDYYRCINSILVLPSGAM